MLTAAKVMNGSAALLNDVQLTMYTFDAQMPYLNMAMVELKEILQQNSIPFMNKTDTSITIAAGVTRVGPDTNPSLPIDLAEIDQLWERDPSSDQDYVQMFRRDFLPSYVVQTVYLGVWAPEGESIKFIGSTSPRQLRIDYISNPFHEIVSGSNVIKYDKGENFLKFRTAGLCAQFIGENKERADDLNTVAALSFDRNLSIEIKATQPVAVRRRPFRSGYKIRSI